MKTVVNYLDRSITNPYRYWSQDENGKLVKNTNIVYSPTEVEITNIRETDFKPTLEGNGFEYVKQSTKVEQFYDREHVKEVYYPEIMNLVKQKTGAEIVSPFAAGCGNAVDTHCIRSRSQGFPIFEAHVDQTDESGRKRLYDLFLSKADDYMRRRVMVINVWRPIRGPLNDVPLAVVDATTVDDKNDLVSSGLKYADLDGSTYKVYYNPEHRWYYMSAMEVEDVLMFKCYDNDKNSNTRFAPHSAVLDRSVSKFIPRESIEMRILAII